MSGPWLLRPKVARAERIALGIGVAGSALSLAAWLASRDGFFIAWLIAWFYWFSIAVGCLGFLMIYRMTGGAWGASLERILLAGGRTFEVLALLFLPLLAGLGHLYPWTHPEIVAASAKLMHKAAYLSVPFWCARTVFYLAAVYGVSWMLTRTQEEGARRGSAGGFVLLFLVSTFGAVDWIMTLEPEWSSTVYGMVVFAGQGISGFAFSLLVMHWLRKDARWNPPLSDKVRKDLGSLLFTACIVWTYLMFAQWLILWIGNVPETVTWFASRATHGWATIAWAVLIGQFALPFQLLLFQPFKTKTRNLAALGLFLLLTRFVDLYWFVYPARQPGSFSLDWAVFPALAAVGGFWTAWFLRQLRRLAPASVGSDCTLRLGELLNHV